MNGFVNVFKPPGMTSHDVVVFFRKKLGVKKVGHTGTLDPDGTGVLPICTGKATKLSEYVMQQKKQYRAGIKLGTTTDTLDSSGTVTGVLPITVDEQQVIDVIKSFKGKISQIPPMYSAIRHKGKRLYDIAREGGHVERKPRKIEIYNIEIISLNIHKESIIDVECSKGTYIRTLCADIGEKLGCGAQMSFIQRTRSGDFDIKYSYTLEQLKELKREGRIESAILPADSVLGMYSAVVFEEDKVKKFLNGVPVKAENGEYGTLLRVYNQEKLFIGLGKIVRKNREKFIKAEKILF